MAAVPSWGFALEPVARWVAACGLPTGLEPPSEPLSGDAWRACRTEVERHRLGGLLVAAAAGGDLPVTDEQRADVAALEVELTLARMAHQARTVEVIHQFEHWGIEVLLLKGAALSHLDYSDSQLRPTGDLDLLVRGEQLDEAVARLEARGATWIDPDPRPGYSAIVGKGATLVLADGVDLDLHRLLVWGPLGVRVPADELWWSVRRLLLEDSVVRTLGLEETLLHVSYHLVIGGWRRGLSLRDVAQLLLAPDLDVERACALARRWGAEAVLATAARLATVELDLAAELDLLDWAEGYPVTLRDRLWLRVERPEQPLGALESLAVLVELGTPAERSAFLRATLQPAPGTWASPVERIAARARRAGPVRRVG